MPGQTFRKLDLHVHTPASKCYASPDHTPAQIVQAALAQHLDGIAITDHNTAAWIDQMRQAAEETGLVIFPGVEISVSEGFHLVALFDPSQDQKHVENFLGAIKITADKYGQQDALSTRSTYEIIDTIHECQGLAIMAHIDSPRGAFNDKLKVREGGKISVPAECSKLFNDAKYDAVECVDGRLPDNFDPSHQFKREPALYQASDNPAAADSKKHAAEGIGILYSWFSVEQVNLEGLRLCFEDPEVRIVLMNEKEEVHFPQIVSMRVGDSGFLRGQLISFVPGLNSIIGGKGVGKSLAVEFLRFGLDQPSTDPDIAKDYVGKLEKQLGPGNTVEVVYELSDGTQYKVERTYLGKEKHTDTPRSQVRCTNLSTGLEYVGNLPQIVPILPYSQTEIIKITENKEAQLKLIDRFIENETRQVEQQIREVRTALEINDTQLVSGIQAHELLSGCETQIATLQERIDTINKALDNPLFAAMKAAEAKKQAFEARQADVHGLIDRVKRWRAEILKNGIEGLPQALAEDSQLQAQQTTATQARNKVLDTLATLLTELEAAEQSIKDGRDAWMPVFEKTAADYAELLKTIGGDRQVKELQRQGLEEEKAAHERDARNHRELASALPGLLKVRDGLLDRLEQAYRSYYEIRKAKFDQLTQLSDGKLKLSLEHAADHTRYEARLNELLKGGPTAPSVADRAKIAQNVPPRRLVEFVLNRDSNRLMNEAGITETIATRAIEKLWAYDDFVQVLALQHDCYPVDVPSIRFKKGKTQYDELSELSVGQKCTALLIIALCDGTMPIVIDQPEDALDVVSVWEDIAKKLRRGKRSRQFILTTHNSSVAVAADSEQFIVLEGGATFGRVTAAGAIDGQDVREAVIKHLEGGRVPYKLRARKYNLP